jgi:hypothetical protein
MQSDITPPNSRPLGTHHPSYRGFQSLVKISELPQYRNYLPFHPLHTALLQKEDVLKVTLLRRLADAADGNLAVIPDSLTFICGLSTLVESSVKNWLYLEVRPLQNEYTKKAARSQVNLVTDVDAGAAERKNRTRVSCKEQCTT